MKAVYAGACVFAVVALTALPGCAGEQPAEAEAVMRAGNLEKATFGGGCFWCTEAVFERIPGVADAVSGYMGGTVQNPTYKQVCTGKTGHAEVLQVTYDPAVVSYGELLDLFWRAHDPTTLNRQGNDIGTQYRSVIFYHGEAQKAAAEASRDALERSGGNRGRIVTEITPASEFYPAEDYHQDYYSKNPEVPYCRLVIKPKLDKLDPGKKQ
ncbi:MAG: peptide-methionine (S)-S-oxide reductase MsrA [Lentisphaerae bacterium]|nr:peptide-methionine (S)-S-oxide reductase MsrA [Lentisphaerota bacterium]